MTELFDISFSDPSRAYGGMCPVCSGCVCSVCAVRTGYMCVCVVVWEMMHSVSSCAAAADCTITPCLGYKH